MQHLNKAMSKTITNLVTIEVLFWGHLAYDPLHCMTLYKTIKYVSEMVLGHSLPLWHIYDWRLHIPCSSFVKVPSEVGL